MRTLISFLFFPLIVSAFPQDVVFRSGVSLVRVDVEAASPAGEILTGLQKDDFHIVDNGVAQTPVNFSFEREPLDLILLFDTSRNMSSKLHQILRAVELGFHELQAGDRVCVMSYAGVAAEIAPFTANMEAVNQTILLKVLNSKFAGTANPAGAASEAALRFRREPVSERRRAVLAIGAKPGSNSEAAIRDLWQSNAVFSQIIPDNSGRNRILGGARIRWQIKRAARPLPREIRGRLSRIRCGVCAGVIRSITRYPQGSPGHSATLR